MESGPFEISLTRSEIVLNAEHTQSGPMVSG
jgi:hypothetical protein